MLLEVPEPQAQQRVDRHRLGRPGHWPVPAPGVGGKAADHIGRTLHSAPPLFNDLIGGPAPAARHLRRVPRVHVHLFDLARPILLQRLNLIDQKI